MDAVWSVLGYDAHLADIREYFDSGGRIAIIEGPPGVGKSWLVKGFGAQWEAKGGAAVVAEGDIGRSQIDHYPLDRLMGRLKPDWSGVGSALADTTRAAEQVIGTAGMLTSAAQGLTRLHRGRRHRKIVLADEEQEIVAKLERFGRKKPLLLIADNFHWWDAASLLVVRRLLEPEVQEAYTFLKKMRILVAQTPAPYQVTAHPEVLRHVLVGLQPHRISLTQVPDSDYGSILHAMGVQPIPDDELASTLYGLSGGHLALTSRVAERIIEGETEELLAAQDSHQFVESLIADRITALGELGQRALGLLQVAAVLGLAFRRNELLCTIEEEHRATAELLRLCREEHLLHLSDGECRFVHDLYREFFLTAGRTDRVSIHERLAECLRELRSDEYELRCLNARHAEQLAEAGTLGALACLKSVRNGKSPDSLSPAVLDCVREAGLETAVQTFMRAIKHLNAYEYSECLRETGALPRNMPRSLLAEADYLRAMCHMSTRSEEDRERGRTLLTAWLGYEEVESELGIRLAQLLLYGLTHLKDKTEGIELEARIRFHLSDQVSLSTAARDNMHILDRCAGSLNSPDTAVSRYAIAVEHFAPEDGDESIRKPLEYYRSLVNYGAGLTALLQYDEALEIYAKVRALVEDYPRGTFPRVDYPYSNELAVRFRLLQASPAEAVEQQREIVEQYGVDGDPFYIQNNLAVYHSFNGSPSEAADIYDDLLGTLFASRAEPEASTIYLLSSNRCCSLHVAGEGGLKHEWDELRSVVEDIRYVIQPYMVARHDLLAPVFGSAEQLDAVALDGYLESVSPSEFGLSWKHYRRGFRLTEVEFWREN